MSGIVIPSLHIQIIQSEDDIYMTKPAGSVPVFHGGDKVSGFLEVVTCKTFEFCIDISFEGQLCLAPLEA